VEIFLNSRSAVILAWCTFPNKGAAPASKQPPGVISSLVACVSTEPIDEQWMQTWKNFPAGGELGMQSYNQRVVGRNKNLENLFGELNASVNFLNRHLLNIISTSTMTSSDSAG